jgi:hypothetical protein
MAAVPNSVVLQDASPKCRGVTPAEMAAMAAAAVVEVRRFKEKTAISPPPQGMEEVLLEDDEAMLQVLGTMVELHKATQDTIFSTRVVPVRDGNAVELASLAGKPAPPIQYYAVQAFGLVQPITADDLIALGTCHARVRAAFYDTTLTSTDKRDRGALVVHLASARHHQAQALSVSVPQAELDKRGAKRYAQDDLYEDEPTALLRRRDSFPEGGKRARSSFWRALTAPFRERTKEEAIAAVLAEQEAGS